MGGLALSWIRITEAWSWKPNPQTTIDYPPGEYNVPRACATLAVASGKAVRLRKTNKDAGVEAADGEEA